ncbi:MAG TPA: crosslink repair DNA glycosylase YcaQ family protein, partial [Trebonia sp.]
MSGSERLSLEQARRFAVRAQRLAGPPPEAGVDGLRQVLRAVRCLQLDPVNVVARSHLLVLWSRLGDFDRTHLDTLLWRERWLFEYWAHAASIVLAEDYPVHHLLMRAFPRYPEYREWLTANEEFRRYVLDALRESGPLAAESLEDRAAVGWVSTGWTHGRNVERMLDFLWKQGVITVVGRDGLRRLWGPAAFADMPRLSEREVVERAAELALLALGVARERDIVRHFTRDRYPGLDLPGYGFARRVRVEGGTEDWWVHADSFRLLEERWTPRTTLLSPFDNLICDRERTQRLWDFHYKNEMYVPKAK